jgi:DNA uptake protein ComE-like DNA-binding protein
MNDNPVHASGILRAATRLATLVIAILCASLVGTAQNQNRSDTPGTNTVAPPPEARVDINHASSEELLKVPGMTQSWAGRIARFRPYRTKQDLLDRGVVNSEVYDRIKEFVIAHREKQQ